MPKKEQKLKPDTVVKNYWRDNGFREKGEAGMWAVFEETWAEGRAEGRVEGRAEGIIEAGFELGLSEHNILERLQDRLNIPMQKAQEYFNMFGKQPV